MNTRFKVLSLIVIFALSYGLLYIFFSPDGVISHSAMEKEKTIVEEKVREKEGEVKALRKRSQSAKESDTRDKELVYSFSDEAIFDPVKKSGGDVENNGSIYFETYRILLISLLITLVYSLLIFLFIPLLKRRKRNGRNYRAQF